MKTHTKKQMGIMVIIAVILCGISFYGGMKYAGSKNNNRTFPGQFGMMSNGDKPAGSRIGTRAALGGMVSGEILSRDEKSLTVKDRSGGSKIVFLGSSTEVMKSAQGTIDDLAVGTSVITNGTPNADGSITATTIQIRPEASQGEPIRQ